MADETNPGDNERDSRISALYRSAAAEEPPAAVDDAIRAAARRAVAAGPRRVDAPFKRWKVPLALAAVVVLSVSVVTSCVRKRQSFTAAGRPAVCHDP
jgi:hypothetical protein